jgi:hypothetical protein
VDDPVIRQALHDRGARLLSGCDGRLQDDDLNRLRERFSLLDSQMALGD